MNPRHVATKPVPLLMRLGSLGARSEGREDPKDFFPAALGTGSQLQARKSPRNEVTEVAGDSAGVPLSRRPPAVRARDKRARVGDGTPGFHPCRGCPAAGVGGMSDKA
jgi:hypothetical protein